MTKKDIAITFLQMASSGKVREAFDAYIHPEFIHTGRRTMRYAGVPTRILAVLMLALGMSGCLDELEDRRSMEGQATHRSIVEIRSYNLKPGTRAVFHRLAAEEAVPMLQRWNMDVVAYGPSLHDEHSYVLIRAFASLEERQRIEDAFYGSAAWKEGPRDSVLALIESYTTVVLDLDAAAVEALREEKY